MTLSGNEIINIEKSYDFTVNKLTFNSQNVEKNDVFFAVKGFVADGNKYTSDVLQKGAMAVITDGDPGISDNRIHKVQDVRKAMAVISSAFYGNPSSKLKMIAVTGTNGKTTVTSLINFVLMRCGKKTGLIGTNGNFINNRFIKTEHTTPEAIDLNCILSKMNDESIEYAVMEVSSHSLALHRVYGIDFDIAVFTNLTPEHLDFHKDMENYSASKKLLFDSLKRIGTKGIKTAAVYNCNDDYGSVMVSGCEAERIAYGFGCGTFTAKNIKMDISGMKFDVLVPRNGENIEEISIKTKLTGKFNVHNILAAIAVLHTINISYSEITEYIPEFDAVEGRFNRVKIANGADVIIDYSHTPDSLLKAITAIKEILNENKPKGKIITVFGCGGNRDKLKRPVMGEIASEHSDEVIITSDNPRDEDPMQIINEIISGIKKDNYTIEENRELAINKAIEQSGKNDIILIAGKGHETYQEIKGVKNHFSDREIAEKFGK